MAASDLKSLAHPDWPYAGTPHEWRGFVKNEGRHYAPVTPIEQRHLERLIELRAIEVLKDYKGVLGSLTPEQHRSITEISKNNPAAEIGIYQKQNFGPELD